MKRFIKNGLCTAALLCSMYFTSTADTAFNRVIAVVNEDIITQHELDQAIDFTRKEQNLPEGERYSLHFQKGVLAHLIIDKIVSQLAAMNHMTISDDEVSAAISEISNHAHIPLEHFKEAIEAQGISFDLYQKKIREKLLVTRLEHQAIAPHIQLNPLEVKEQVKLMQDSLHPETTFEISHILIPIPDENSRERSRAEIQAVVEAYHKGLPFKQLAQKYSKAPDAKSGGSLGVKPLDELPAIFVEPVQNLSPGEISPIIETDSGFHVITLEAIHSPFSGPFLVDEVHLAQIVINITPLVSDAKAHATILSIIHDIINHKDSFSTLAKRTSEDPISASKNGDLGWLALEKLPPELQIGIEHIQEGHISDPIRSEKSWSVVQVIARRKEDRQELHQQYLASQVLFEKKALAALQAWKAQIRNESYVQILDPSLRIESLK